MAKRKGAGGAEAAATNSVDVRVTAEGTSYPIEIGTPVVRCPGCQRKVCWVYTGVGAGAYVDYPEDAPLHGARGTVHCCAKPREL